MRSVTALLALTLLGGCAKSIKPSGPVLTPYERARDFGVQFSGAKYIGAAHTDAPVLPFMAFGATYDLDIAVGLKDDRWDMIELARLQRPDQPGRPMWVVIESRAGSKEQALIANVDEINGWMPELPLYRKSGGLEVEDRTTSDGLDIRVKYDNIDNQRVELILQGDPPEKLARKRNGNTMGHSSNDLLAVLDVSSSNSLFKADVRIDDKNVRARKVAAILPLQFALTQTQGGIARGEYRQELGKEIPFGKNAEFDLATKWEPPPPPPPEPVIPAPKNPATEEVMLLAMDQWTPVPDKDKKKALDAQETKLDVCLVAATIADPAYQGLVKADFHVKKGAPWEITIAGDSTGTELVWSCVQETIAGWKFDEKLDGSIHVDLAKFPAGYAGETDAEKAWIAANPAPAEDKPMTRPEEKKPEEKKPMTRPEEKKPEGSDLPEEGEDLLDGEGAMDDDAKAAAMSDAVMRAFTSIHRMADGTDVQQDWKVKRTGDRVWVWQDSGMRKMTYEFLVLSDALELHSIRVENWGQANPAFSMTFSPALPDLSRPFSGKVTSKFVMDVGGQQSHATGTAVAESTETGAKVTITPTAPDWASSRPMISQIDIKNGVPNVLVRMAK
ncbi:MAG: hypothetical protein H6737_18260 [Alphaproteobacteria bacterium]|nr:hypothetical protein [Alphaproteobacteria bacterium]